MLVQCDEKRDMDPFLGSPDAAGVSLGQVDRSRGLSDLPVVMQCPQRGEAWLGGCAGKVGEHLRLLRENEQSGGSGAVRPVDQIMRVGELRELRELMMLRHACALLPRLGETNDQINATAHNALIYLT